MVIKQRFSKAKILMAHLHAATYHRKKFKFYSEYKRTLKYAKPRYGWGNQKRKNNRRVCLLEQCQFNQQYLEVPNSLEYFLSARAHHSSSTFQVSLFPESIQEIFMTSLWPCLKFTICIFNKKSIQRGLMVIVFKNNFLFFRIKK